MIKKILNFSSKRKITAGIIAAVVIAGGYQSYKSVFRSEEAVRYTLAQAQRGVLVVSVSGSGRVSFSDRVDVKPKVSGELLALYVSLDQEVRAGQLIAVIDDRSAKRAVNGTADSDEHCRAAGSVAISLKLAKT